MHFEAFKTIIAELHTYFRLKQQPSQEALNLWFKKVNSIPDEAGKWIANWMTSEFDSMPWNIPRTFLKGWQLYKRKNRHKMVNEHQRTSCNDCYGEGILWFKWFNPKMGLNYTHACRCGNCENWRRHVGSLAIPLRLTLDQLKDCDVETMGRPEDQMIMKDDACESL